MSRVKLVLLSVSVALAVSAVASASASALEFYKCVNVGAKKGRFENSDCIGEGGSKEWELELLRDLLKITLKQTAPYKLEGKIVGITVEIVCENQKGTGSIHNGQTEKDLEPGKATKILTGLGLISSVFERCAVPKPAGEGCLVEQPIVVQSTIQLSTSLGRTYILFSPDPMTNKVFVQITLAGCTTTALNNMFPVEGMAAGLMDNEASTLSFRNEEPNKKLTFGGNPARFVGESSIEMEGGGFINAH